LAVGNNQSIQATRSVTRAEPMSVNNSAFSASARRVLSGEN
jgi:hypothetical protein